eukprot:CAMPEP_0198615238 /NCGR_PEP_ID=MMETSP1462-20131121/159292_1 /TAXON_ID=1333877 /ORGANISM="Brandtodinium nutriculum, Strain RCC3387" /LENGTH=350 /DNA_ID=CAMNT_0044347037 /DNA_START=171 /DNA_END=1220 /DNA_ORIENTATION=-
MSHKLWEAAQVCAAGDGAPLPARCVAADRSARPGGPLRACRGNPPSLGISTFSAHVGAPTACECVTGTARAAYCLGGAAGRRAEDMRHNNLAKTGAVETPQSGRPPTLPARGAASDRATRPEGPLKLVQVVPELGHLHLDILALADLQNQLLHLAALLRAVPLQVLPVVEHALREGLPARGLPKCGDEAEGLGHRQMGLHLHLAALLRAVPLQVFPMVEHALREGLPARGLPESGDEAEGLGHGQVGLHLDERGALTLVLLEDATAPQVHAVVHAAHRFLRARDLDEEHGLLQGRLGRQLRREAAAARRGHDLAGATVDGVGVERHIHEVEADAAHVFLAQRSLLGRPLE